MNLDQAKIEIKHFFEQFADTFNHALQTTSQANLNAITEAYASCFVESSPSEVSCSVNDEKFYDSIPRKLECRRSIGARFMKISSLVVEPIDDMHFLTKAKWTARFIKPNDRELDVDFEVAYLLRKDIDGKFKIFCHVNGNELEALNENGLLPNQNLPEDFYVF